MDRRGLCLNEPQKKGSMFVDMLMTLPCRVNTLQPVKKLFGSSVAGTKRVGRVGSTRFVDPNIEIKFRMTGDGMRHGYGKWQSILPVIIGHYIFKSFLLVFAGICPGRQEHSGVNYGRGSVFTHSYLITLRCSSK